ncbi:hypothetical protein BFP97_09770 [Roseivirga sp. 4D4]|nr:hypothetical protein BFP97_09770 [Roseivirga sp. 4D4]
MAYAPTFWDTVDANVIGGLIYSVGVYVNLYILVPHLLLKGKQLIYCLVMIIWLMIMAYAAAEIFVYIYRDVSPSTSEFFGSAGGLASTAVEFLVVYALATSLFFINEWYIKERKLRELESQNLKAELDLLKGQINPHFLFNALNSVHVLIRTNPDLATQTLEKFSDLLSHQLYDVDKDKITLQQEVRNLDNFIQLQKMRHQDHVEVNASFDIDSGEKAIAPMVFLNFVENAFKHGSGSDDGKVKVDIKLSFNQDQLVFRCTNSFVEQGEESKKIGLGIANARRRLDIIYPSKYELSTGREGNEYIVLLKLDLSES